MKTDKTKARDTDQTVYGGQYLLLTLTALCTLAAPYVYLLIVKSLPFPALTAVGLTALCITAGYGWQSLWGNRLGCTRLREERSYEMTERFFQPTYAVPSLMLVPAVFFLTCRGTKAWLDAVRIAAHSYDDPYTLIPFLVGVAAALCFFIGAGSWFYPFTRLVSFRNIIALCAAFVVNAVLTLIYSGGTSLLFVTVCLFVFLCAAFFLLNQGAMLFNFARTKYTRVTSGARRYSFAVMIPVILLFVVLILGVLSVVVGLSGTVKGVILYLIRLTLRGESTQYDDPDEAGRQFTESVFSGMMDPLDIGGGFAKAFFLIFYILILLAAVFFLIARQKAVWNALKRFFLTLSEMLMRFLEALFAVRGREEEEPVLSYVEEELTMEPEAVKELTEQTKRKKPTYRQYLRNLSALTDSGERVRYAYRTLVRCWRDNAYGLSASDTPREIRDKVVKRYAGEDLDSLTHLFEALTYAETEAKPEECEKLVEQMSRMIRRFG